MSTVTPSKGPRFDTRGLPEGMDPRKFYEYRTGIRAQDATGLEGFLYKLMPFDLIKSFAFAIDPLSSFKTSQGVVTPFNRTRYKTSNTIFNGNRKVHYYRYATHWESMSNYLGIPGDKGPIVYDPNTVLDNRLDGIPYVTQQPILPQISKDSTRRTRLLGSDVGEFEKFEHQVFSSGRSIRKRNTSVSSFYNPSHSPTGYDWSFYGGGEHWDHAIIGQSAILPVDTYNYHYSGEQSRSDAYMQKYGLAMLKEISPTSRSYSLFRNIVELRDLPRTILQLKDTIGHLRQLDVSLRTSERLRKKLSSFATAVDDVPKEYLAYHFGWKQTYRDVMDLLNTPSKIAKKMNLLIARNGVPTTYRSRRTFTEADTGIPGFNDYIIPYGEDHISTNTRVERDMELRMVVNTTFSFPKMDEPRFKDKYFLDQLGVYPRFTDFYNLVPWTWLVDWFTGLGNYVEIIDNIWHDQSLINWGFLTYESKGRVQTNMQSRVQNSDTITTQNVSSNQQSYVYSSHTSSWDYSFQRRKDLSTILDVNATTDATSLTPYQQSILGALLAQRNKFSRI